MFEIAGDQRAIDGDARAPRRSGAWPNRAMASSCGKPESANSAISIARSVSSGRPEGSAPRGVWRQPVPGRRRAIGQRQDQHRQHTHQLVLPVS